MHRTEGKVWEEFWGENECFVRLICTRSPEMINTNKQTLLLFKMLLHLSLSLPQTRLIAGDKRARSMNDGLRIEIKCRKISTGRPGKEGAEEVPSFA